MKILIIALALMLSGCSYLTHVSVGKYSVKHSASMSSQYP
jgi:PBP1b-binding outer membrane lipoprotein LpoB